MSDDTEVMIRRRAVLCHEIMSLKGKSAGVKFLDRICGLPEEYLIKIRDELKQQQEAEDDSVRE